MGMYDSMFNDLQKYYMQTYLNRTKTLVISENPQRCKRLVDGRTIEFINRFNYLGVEITSPILNSAIYSFRDSVVILRDIGGGSVTDGTTNELINTFKYLGVGMTGTIVNLAIYSFPDYLVIVRDKKGAFMFHAPGLWACMIPRSKALRNNKWNNI